MSKKERKQNPISYQAGESSGDLSLEGESPKFKDLGASTCIQKVWSFLYTYRTESLLFLLIFLSCYVLSVNYSLTNSAQQLKAQVQISFDDIEADLRANFSLQLATQAQLSQSVHAVAVSQLAFSKPSISQNTTHSDQVSCPPLDLYTLGLKYGTDKVTTHVYYITYQRYFEKSRCQPIKILEIGLGCDMSYGPGASFYLWLEYFPYAEIYFIEYDAPCAKAWANVDKRVHVFQGDQANVTFLNEFIKKSGGEFDFIIDDGGHSMNQQIVSLENLVPALKSEGVYFIEDLLTSYIPLYDGGEEVQNTTLNYIREMLGDVMSRRQDLAKTKRNISESISRIDCIDENCAFTKKKKSN
jgi:hypothetical protein